MGGKGSGRRSGRDWSNVDWSLRNAEIARRMGVSDERVRVVRETTGAGPPAPTDAERFRAFVAANKPALRGLTAHEAMAAAEVRLNPTTASEILRAAGVRPARKPGVGSVLANVGDWRLPSPDIARLWGLAVATVNTYRSRRRKPPPLWSVQSPRTFTDPEYLKAVTAEERKARETK